MTRKLETRGDFSRLGQFLGLCRFNSIFRTRPFLLSAYVSQPKMNLFTILSASLLSLVPPHTSALRDVLMSIHSMLTLAHSYSERRELQAHGLRSNFADGSYDKVNAIDPLAPNQYLYRSRGTSFNERKVPNIDRLAHPDLHHRPQPLTQLCGCSPSSKYELP